MTTLRTNRIGSIDLLRGIIMIIMALDHTRDYFHAGAFQFDPLDLQKTSILLFFTRWITHFCAPIFILLAGVSAFISGQRKTKTQLAHFLIKRGLWLILLEMTIVNFAWFFNPEFPIFLLGVIWILGVGMICLAGFVFLPRPAILIIGLILIGGHNLLDSIHFNQHDAAGFLWGLFHERKIFMLGHVQIMEGYLIIPWIGVMAVGYVLGSLYANGFDAAVRRRMLVRLGIASWLLFIIIRGINRYGDLFPWASQPTAFYSFLSFINFSKYPPSLDYLLVTDGAALIFLGISEQLSNGMTKIISVYGRVPLFFYLLHLYLIHLGAVVAAAATGFDWHVMTSFNSWVTNMPGLKTYGFRLSVVYGIWIAVLILLYPLCRAYDRYKTVHKEKWWLSYL